MFKKLISGIIFVFIVCLTGNVWAANNVEACATTIELSSLDSNWLSSTETKLTADQRKHGLYIFSIEFKPAATDDECIIYVGNSTSGVLTIPWICADKYDERIKYFPPNTRRQIFLDYDNGTYSSGSMVIIELWAE